jgi:predicted O-methyltransferase YrrM
MSAFTFLAFLRNRWKGKRWDSFHSPYLFRLFSFIRNDKIRLDKFKAIEQQRKNWLNDISSINRTDFGMGSIHAGKMSTESISKIASRALSRPFQCRCLARLVHQEKPGFILELGTSLGISTAYLQTGCSSANVTTVEGDPEISKLAKITFEKLGLNTIQLVTARFDDFLKNEITNTTKIDLLFLDGHHQSAALLRYYDALKNRFTPGTIVIVDDIYWSKDMNKGWKKLIAMPEVTQSADCFQFGVLFFRNEFLAKEHHTLRVPLRALF